MFYKTMFKKTTSNETCLNWCEQGISHCFSFNILDMDECKFNISDCDVNANCTNTFGS